MDKGLPLLLGFGDLALYSLYDFTTRNREQRRRMARRNKGQ